ncbi:50S ribosomal protein L10 [Candidatus Uhrbacteria bacterium]|nr:50S ribosomal protein L10 [Candidatus Uhrbacteria bacterium]MBD3283891.1 50S ribosomal protein L10 [Candidatus Uhrbacteria bacterium]
MAKTREQKQVALDRLVKEFKDAKSVAFADYRGLTVPQVDELRSKMREANVHYVVAKKTLATQAAKKAGFEVDTKQYDGMFALAFGVEDEIAPAKVLGDMSKTTSVQILGGIFDGAVVPREQVEALSRLPSKLELLGTVVGTMYAPVSAFVRVLNAIKEEREKAEGAPVEVAPEPQESTESADATAAQPSAPEQEADASTEEKKEASTPEAAKTEESEQSDS